MSDQHITCSECGGSFVFTESERQFYETKGLSGPPKRCKTCRAARKAADPGRAGGFRGGGRDGGGPPRGAPGGYAARGGNDRPRGGPPAQGGPAPGGWGRMGGGDAARTGGYGGRPAAGGFRDRGPARGDAFARNNNGASAGAPHGGVGGAPRGGQGRPERPRFGDGPSRREIRTDVGPKPRPAPAEAGPPRPKKAKPERPKFDVTCIECGTAAQVPFKPIEGRDVFCQPCYRARRGIVAPTTEPNMPTAPPAPETAPDASADTSAEATLE
jgi:CxxC-x17-CxxC domain-containing protein